MSYLRYYKTLGSYAFYGGVYGYSTSQGKTSKPWSRTSVQNLVKPRRGGYYSRLFTGGKERWKSLRTKALEAAKARLREEQRNADQFAHLAKPTKSGRMTMSMAVETLRKCLRPGKIAAARWRLVSEKHGF